MTWRDYLRFSGGAMDSSSHQFSELGRFLPAVAAEVLELDEFNEWSLDVKVVGSSEADCHSDE